MEELLEIDAQFIMGAVLGLIIAGAMVKFGMMHEGIQLFWKILTFIGIMVVTIVSVKYQFRR